MTQNGVCIRSVFEQKIGPYKVCILVNMGPFERLAALLMLFPVDRLNGGAYNVDASANRFFDLSTRSMSKWPPGGTKIAYNI